MKIEVGKTAGVRILPVFNDKKPEFFDTKKERQLKDAVKKELASYPFEGKKDELLFLKADGEKVLLLGLAKDYTSEDIRKSYATICKALKGRKEYEVCVELPNDDEGTVIAAVEGMDLGDYRFDRYLNKKDEQKKEQAVSLDIDPRYKKTVQDTLTITKNVKTVRDLVNENADIVTPEHLASLVSEYSKKHALKCTILDEKEIRKEGLNLITAVGQGAHHPPRLIIAEYEGDPGSKERIALVGKGITFDTGGLHTKNFGYMEDMKTDMAGAAACLGTFMDAVELKIKKNIILVIPSAENAVSGHAYKPGDVITSYSGVSVEIGNTDAEGRLVLADGIAYVQKNYKITELIDIATLTGAVKIALGPTVIGMLGNDKGLKDIMFKAGEDTYERVWELPLYDEHRDAIKGKFGDINNFGGSEGGTSNAAAFIERFIEKGTKWIHLDIAGAARSKKESAYIPEFGTGRGVRLLTAFLRGR